MPSIVPISGRHALLAGIMFSLVATLRVIVNVRENYNEVLIAIA
jgi:hypothetical protein